MTRAGWIRLGLIVGAFALLEWACRYGYVSREAVIPPTVMLQGAWRDTGIASKLCDETLMVEPSSADGLRLQIRPRN